MAELRADMAEIRVDVGELRADVADVRERMARFEGAVGALTEFLVDRERRRGREDTS